LDIYCLSGDAWFEGNQNNDAWFEDNQTNVTTWTGHGLTDGWICWALSIYILHIIVILSNTGMQTTLQFGFRSNGAIEFHLATTIYKK
jgi:hypothetical protein